VVLRRGTGATATVTRLEPVRAARRLTEATYMAGELRRYWSLDPARREEPDPDRLWQELADAVELRLVADVPVGSFLSGGLDSSAIVAATAERNGRPDTFTVVFSRPEERLYDERDDARLVASAFGTSHHELEARADAQALLPEIVRHFDEPFGNPTALLVYELSRLTRQHVKVALAGDGSDELFAGYPRFRGLAAASWYTPRWASVTRTGAPRRSLIARMQRPCSSFAAGR